MKTKHVSTYRLIGLAACGGAVIVMACGASAQNLFISTYAQDTVVEMTPGGSQSVLASGLSYSTGVALNSAGDLFIGNSDNNNYSGSTEYGNIIEIAPNGTQTTLASGVDPQAMAMNSAGYLFETDYRSGNIYEYSPSGVQSTFASGFSNPLSIAINGAGDVFVGAGWGNGNGYITEITPNGTQSLFASGLNFPHGLAFNSAGNLFVTSEDSGAISEFTPKGVESTFATTAAGGLDGLAFNNAGNLFAADGSSSGNIYEITPGGGVSTFASVAGGYANDLAFQPVPEPSVLVFSTVGCIGLLVCRRPTLANNQ